MSKFPFKIVLIDSGVPKSTKRAVGRVRELYDDQTLQNIGKDVVSLISNVTD